MIETIYSDPNYLEHHGVKGMRWGRRKQKQTTGKKRSKSSNAKKVLKGAAIAAGLGLATYGGYKVSKAVGTKNAAKAVSNIADNVSKFEFDKFEYEPFTYATTPIEKVEVAKTVVNKTNWDIPLSGINSELYNKNAELLKKAQGLQHSDELYHHGVKGMRWGVRHDDERTEKRRKRGLTSKQKKTIKTIAAIGATAAITGLAIYGVKTLSATGVDKGILGLYSELENSGIKVGKEFADDFVKDTFVDKDGLTKLKNFNPNFSKGSNCYAASGEFQFKEMHGVEVTAQSVHRDSNGRVFGQNPKDMYTDVYSDFETISKVNANKGMDAVKNQLKTRISSATNGKDSVGGIILHGKTSNGESKGHTLSWRLKNGEFILVDADGALNRDYSSSFANGSWNRNVEFYIADKEKINWDEVKKNFLE